MKTLMALATLAFLGCGSAQDVPRYTTRVEPVGGDTWSLHLDSVTTMSPEDVKRALLTEAARAAIDRGMIYLRVHELLYEGSVIEVHDDTGRDVAPPSAPTSTETPVRSEVSFSRQRSGSVRFTISRERPEGERVFDASRLLDQLQRGEMPM